MISKNINFKKFSPFIKDKKVKEKLKLILSSENEIINSLKKKFKLNYDFKKLKKIQKNLDLRIIGIGGSILGAKAIFSFLNHKIKKKILFIDNLKTNFSKKPKKNYTNLIISKSGNTLETIININLLIKKNDKNIFLTENKNNYLIQLGQKLKSEVVHHNNYIGGRYSVLSETGMLPAEFMGLNVSKFKQLNNLIKNSNFLNSIVANVNTTLFLLKKKNLILLL